MTASYYRSPVRHVWYVRPFRWDWEVTDGIGGRVLVDDGDLLAGHAWTQAGADVDSILAQTSCKPALQLRLDRAAERLTREGLPVRVRLDEQSRACVQFLCACSTRDEVRGLSAILAITPNVRREVA